jgi:hypothetical protein
VVAESSKEFERYLVAVLGDVESEIAKREEWRADRYSGAAMMQANTAPAPAPAPGPGLGLSRRPTYPARQAGLRGSGRPGKDSDSETESDEESETDDNEEDEGDYNVNQVAGSSSNGLSRKNMAAMKDDAKFKEWQAFQQWQKTKKS